jgi:dTDP-4-dehydrorhamnose reductase
MSVVLLGADGMLGSAFAKVLPSRGEPFAARVFPEIDLRSADSVASAIDGAARVVINCTAYTDVDAAESHEDDANAVNGHGVGTLARRCAAIGATLVHFGTDYVFSGEGSAPYPVDAELAPRGAYGRSKAMGETLLRTSGADHLLVRTSWLYAPWGKNFVRTIAKAANERDELRVVDDQRGRPTSAEGLVTTTLALLDAGARGTFHATDDGECTWYELATHIVATTHARARVSPCTSAELARPAPRPPYSVLDLAKTHAIVPPAAHWRIAVADVLARLPPA